MSQGILWTIIAILILVIIGLFLVVGKTKAPAVETPAPEVTGEALTPTPSLEPTSTPTPTPLVSSVSVVAQPVGRTVTIDSVSLAVNGFVVLHADSHGKPEVILGQSDLLSAGTHTNVTITLTRRTRKGEMLYAMLHKDGDLNGKFLFPGPDVPLVDTTGAVIMAPFSITAVTASPSPSATPLSSSPSPSSSYTY